MGETAESCPEEILPPQVHMGLTREEPLMSWGLLWTECLLSLHVDALTPSGMVFGGGGPMMAAGPLEEETGAHAWPCAASKDRASRH